MTGDVSPAGALSFVVDRKKSHRPVRRWAVRNWFRMFRTGELVLPLWAWLYRRVPGTQVVVAELRGRVAHADGSATELGLLGRHLVVTAGKNFLAGCMDGTNTAGTLKFHGFGTGTTAAAVGDTALQTELTSQYATSNTRPTGSQAHSTNTYTTVATLAPTANVAVTEWGLLSQAANSGGTLFDHQVFSAVNLVGNSDSLQVTYTLTFS